MIFFSFLLEYASLNANEFLPSVLSAVSTARLIYKLQILLCVSEFDCFS